MVRKNRVSFPGAIFHITARGIRKSDLFLDIQDRESYLDLLIETKQLHPFNILAYCLMTNHVHLLIETITTNTGVIFKHLHTKYAKNFNAKYHYSGHVFESRYGAELIDSSAYLLDASKYIHMNPLKANIVDSPEQYPWSSYNSYTSDQKDPIITTEKILSYFSEPKLHNYKKYFNASSLEQEIPSITGVNFPNSKTKM